MYRVKIIKGMFCRCKGNVIRKHKFLKDNYVIVLDKYDIETIVYKDDFVRIENDKR